MGKTSGASEVTMKKPGLSRRGQIFVALGVFVITSSLAIIMNGLVMRQGIDFRYSISRYVGMETFSALIFALGNFYVAYTVFGWLYEVGESLKMPKLFFVLVLIVAVALIGLSVCPLGYFDQQGGVSVPSRIHKLCSRTMFGTMAIMAFLFQTRREVLGRIKIWSVIYVCFAVLCALGYFFEMEWFLKWFLIFEASYIVGFMILIMNLKPRTMTDGLRAVADKSKTILDKVSN